MGQGGRVVAFAGRARFDGVNSGVGERTGDDVRVEHPDTKGAGDCPRGVGVSCLAKGRLRHMLIGYARVSKTDGSQSLDLQRDALRAAGIDDATNLYHDRASGVRDDRPAACEPCGRATCSSSGSSTGWAGTSPTWSTPCRICRPAGWACGVLAGQGAQIDTTTAAGRLVFGIFAALADGRIRRAPRPTKLPEPAQAPPRSVPQSSAPRGKWGLRGVLGDGQIMQNEYFDERRQFADRPADEREPGPARAVDIRARCAHCWGAVSGNKDGDGRWNHIECRVCGCSIRGDDAACEAVAMQAEVADNMAPARVGHPAKYRTGAGFVLKILPDMDRDRQLVDGRIAASLLAERKRGRLTRHEIPRGTAGYLYAQARAFLAGLDNLLSAEMSAFASSDLEFGEPQVSGIDSSAAGALHVTGTIPVAHRKPSERALMGRLGTAIVAGMSAAFACEVGITAVPQTFK